MTERRSSLPSRGAVPHLPPGVTVNGRPVCPMNPSTMPRRPVRYAWCTGCGGVVKAGRPCPLEDRDTEAGEA